MLDEVVNKLRKRGACSVVLFGSAVDTPFPDDFDLLVIVEDAPDGLENRVNFEVELTRDLLGPFDFVIVTREEFLRMAEKGEGLYPEIYDRHKVLFDNGFFKNNLRKPRVVKVGEGLWKRTKQ